MSNVNTYLDTFAAIERRLRDLTQSERGVSFSSMLTLAARADPAVHRFYNDLKEFADLRNAVVHERGGGRPIADPNDWAVARIKAIADQIISPPRVWPQFQVKVFALGPDASIAEAVTKMQAESFSQIPIYDGNQFIGMLTSNTVARWLGANVKEDILSLSETTIRTVLAHTEYDDHVAFIVRDTTLVEVVECFQSALTRGRRIDALIITQSGKDAERPLGIITVYDLVQINKLLSV